MRRVIAMLGAGLALAGCSGGGAQPRAAAGAAPMELTQAGLVLAQAQCAACHAVAGAGPSPNPNAPPFQDIRARYDFDVLREELIAGVHVGPGEMPTFALSLDEVDALMAYLESVQTSPR